MVLQEVLNKALQLHSISIEPSNIERKYFKDFCPAKGLLNDETFQQQTYKESKHIGKLLVWSAKVKSNSTYYTRGMLDLGMNLLVHQTHAI